jgi:hypothetical protein
MKCYYQQKRDFHHREWIESVELGKEISAKDHKEQYQHFAKKYDELVKEVGE